jgi:hypothetical protein
LIVTYLDNGARAVGNGQSASLGDSVGLVVHGDVGRLGAVGSVFSDDLGSMVVRLGSMVASLGSMVASLGSVVDSLVVGSRDDCGANEGSEESLGVHFGFGLWMFLGVK